MKRVSKSATVGCALPDNCTIDDGAYIKRSMIEDGAHIGKDSVVLNSTIGGHTLIEKRNLVRDSKVGFMSYTGSETSIMWSVVGKYCSISRMVDIGGNEHDYHAVTTQPEYRFRNELGGKGIAAHHDEELLEIGNDVWIGQGASIIRKQGLNIGHGAVIGTGAVVTKAIPPYAIAVGVPAKVINYRFPEGIIERLLELNWWDWPQEFVKKHWPLLTSELTEEVLNQLFELKAIDENASLLDNE